MIIMLSSLSTPNGFVLEGFLTHCSFDYISRDIYTRTYMLTLILIGFLLPLIVIISIYILLWKKIFNLSKINNFKTIFKDRIHHFFLFLLQFQRLYWAQTKVKIETSTFSNSCSINLCIIQTTKKGSQKQLKISIFKILNIYHFYSKNNS